jgi:NADPH:quinone reductase-like Zn-dependent oxidoreductase
MKALQYDHPGVPREALKLRELPLPAPGSGALRLQIAYAPIHPSDLNLIEGTCTYGTQDILPAIPGGEASAHVDAPFAQKPVPAESASADAKAARVRVQAVLDKLSPANGKTDSSAPKKGKGGKGKQNAKTEPK